MSVAVVFDSAGTLMNTYRVAKDICHKKLLPGIETTTLTFSSPGPGAHRPSRPLQGSHGNTGRYRSFPNT